MSKLRLSLACWNYDRVRGLLEGRIPVDGIDLTFLNLPVEETFFRMLRHLEFDVAEMSLSSYVLSLFAEHPPYYCDSRFSIPLLSALLHLHQPQQWNSCAERFAREASGNSGISNDRWGLDSRNSE